MRPARMEVSAFVITLSVLSGLTATVTTAADNHSTANTVDQGISYFTEPVVSEFEQPSYASSQDACPTWFRHDSGKCVCGSSLDGLVYCDPSSNQTSIFNCNGMTFSNIRGKPQTVVGACIYNCFNATMYIKDTAYSSLPSNVSLLNDRMCDHLNRKGVLCGDCKGNFYLAPYTYYIGCFNCTYSPYNWLWYAAVAYIPLTVFFVIMVSCRISVISGQLTAFVSISQMLTASVNIRMIVAAIDGRGQSMAGPAWMVKVLAAIYGVWNLDFFRTLLPPICLKVSFLQATALDYGIAVYPLILIGISYALIELHDRNFRLVVWVWRPFHRCFARLRNQWDMKTSIIDAFATFLFLSYTKIFTVSTDILLFTNVYDIEGRQLTKRLYYNASVEYFSAEHLPYAITAIAVLIIFVLTPLILLLLYPLRVFQKCLDCCHLRTHLLTTFVDSVQGCYKDGTNGTRDYRYFSAAYIIMRLALVGLYSITLGVYFYSLASILLVTVAILYFVFRPYKKSVYNYVDVILYLDYAMWCTTALDTTHSNRRNDNKLSYLLAILFSAGPLVYITVLFLHWLIARKRLPQKFLLKIKRCIQGSNFSSREDTEHILPHRLEFPGQYNRVAPLDPEAHPAAADEDGCHQGGGEDHDGSSEVDSY